MASFNKVTYVDNETVIHAANLNAIQDSTLQNEADIDTLESGKVDKVTGKGLSTNDFTTALLNKLSALPTGSELEAALAEKLDLDDFNEQIEPLEASVEALEETQYDPYIVDTASGDIASFPDGADGIPMKKLVANIEPVQDLHGYDNPWPAGGGANLCDYTTMLQRQGYTNITMTEVNGLMTFSGRSTGGRFVAFVAKVISGQQYTIKCQNNSMGDSPYVSFSDTEPTSAPVFQGSKRDIDEPWTITATGSYLIVAFEMSDSLPAWSINKLQVVAGSTATDATWSPWSNICPISGWTKANVTRTGINIWNGEYETGTISDNGEDYSGGVYDNFKRTKGYILCSPNTSYYLKSESKLARLFFYDANKTFISLIVNPNGVITTGATTCYIRFRSADSVANLDDVCLNYPSTDHDYHEGHVQTVEVTFPAGAGTVYGGTLNVTSGELTVDKVGVDMGSLGWGYNGEIGGMRRFSVAVPSMDTGYAADVLSSIFSQSLTPVGGSPKIDNSICRYAGALYANCDRFDNYSAFTTFVTGQTVVYPLATPVEYTLTPTQVTTLLGTNNVWFDTGDTACEYRADTKKYITKVIAAALNA